jgi:hypothetical protein
MRWAQERRKSKGNRPLMGLSIERKLKLKWILEAAYTIDSVISVMGFMKHSN